MIRFYPVFQKLIVFSGIFFCMSTLKAQQGRLPNQQELDVKEALLKQYKSNTVGKQAPGHLSVTGPEQDCDNAIPVCQQSYTQNTSYTGSGTIQEVNGTCLSSQETNSVWYVFTVQNSGTFTFMLNTANDYDFALYDITTIGCTGVPSATPVRCNYSATYGSTGLTLPASATIPLSVGAGGAPTMAGLNVNAGQTFVLIVDNFSANTNGYTLTFGGTAQIFDNNPPTISSSNFTCNGNSIRINFSEPISCNSIAANGSDFTITGPSGSVPVTGAVGNLCSSGASNTNYATVSFNNTGLPSGTYTVTVGTGTDGNSLIDKCGNNMGAQTVTFQYLAPITVSASSASICAGTATTLSLTIPGAPAGVTFTWSPGGATTQTISVSPSSNISYVATATYGGCSRSATQNIVITQPPVVSVNPNNISLCSGNTTIIATSSQGGSPCTTCSYTWSGTATQTDVAVPASTLNSVGAGTYSVTVSTSNGCLGNTAVSNVSILSPTSTPACNIIYASPAGGGNGLDPATPTDIVTALGMAACNNIVIKMQVGDYTINNPLNVNSFVTLEGGYNVGYTLKTSSTATTGVFPNRGTRIIRSTSNVEGPVGSQRYTGINVVAGSSYFRFQDIRIEMPDNAAGTAISNYGIYLGNSCSNYNITRCYIYSGNAGSGAPGAANTTTANSGGNGGNGSAGNVDEDTDCGAGGGGGGGGGTTAGVNGGNGTGNFNSANFCGAGLQVGGTGGTGGATAGSGAQGGSDPDACSYTFGGQLGGAGATSTSIRSGGGGGGGGSGSQLSVTPISGGNGGGVFSVYGANTTGGAGGADGNPGAAGSTGGAGLAGVNGTVGATGAPGTDATGYWVPGGQGGIGGDGSGGQGGKGGGGGGGQTCFFCIDGSGSGGGGGGGGGQGGTGGTGGFGGGATFGIFIFNNGANGVVSDCQIITGAAGAGGVGGAGQIGGNGGTGGLGSTYSGGEVGRGGNGGAGGKGGNGGAGGSGAAGNAVAVRLVGGAALTTNVSSFTLATQPVLTAENKACTNVTIAHTSTVGVPAWSSFGVDASPASGAGSPASTTYTSTGRKTLTLNASNYTDFNNIIVNPPSTGNIIASAAVICPGSANFVSSVAGTSGLTYSWTAAPAGATIGSVTSSSTSIAFANAGVGPITYTVSLNITSLCCGTLTPITQTITVYPTPAAPTATVNSTCVGGVSTFTASTPAGSSFSWYNAASSGTLLATGNTYSVGAVSTPTTVYLQATNAGGCTSTVTPVSVTPTNVPSPTALSAVSCDPGLVQVGITPASGVTDYNWYSDAGGTTLVQSGTSINYSQTIPVSGGSYTVYVQSTIPGCTPSALVPVTGSVTGSPIVANQTVTANDTVCVNTPVTITLNPTGGNGAYTYSWSPVASTSNSITQSPANSTGYDVTITSGACSKLFSFPIIVLPYPTAAVTNPSTLSCLSPTIMIDGSGSASGSSITYSWTTAGGNIVSPATSNTINVDAPGIYSLTVTDNTGGCASTQTVNVLGNTTVPTVTVSPSNYTITCATSTVMLTANSSTNTLSYSWTTTGGALSATNISNPVASAGGTYSVVITNTVNGCQNTATATIVPDAAIPSATLSSSSVTLTCLSTSETVTVSVNPASDITYAWSPSPASGGATANPTFGAPGTYSCAITNTVNSCATSAQVTVISNTTVPTVTITPSQTITCATPTAVIATTVNPANGISYNWSGPGVTGQSSSSVNATQAGTYDVIVLDAANGCTNTASSSVSSNVAIPTINVSPITTTLTCITTTINLNATTSSATAPTWSTPGGPQTNPVVANSVGDYVVTVNDAVSGCTASQTITITSDNTPPAISAGPITPIPCGAATTTLNGSATPSVGTTYTWSGPSGTSIVSGGNTANPTVNEMGVYSLTVTGSNGCVSTATTSVIQGSVDAQFTANPTTGTSPLAVGFTNQSVGAVTYNWSFGDGNTSTSANPSNTYTNTGVYTVTLIASSGLCSDTAYTTITVEEGLTLEIPNVFTPNNDNVNDVFKIKSTGVKEISLQIFNRWGTKLYEFTGANAAWDGKVGGGADASSGTYFYFVKATGYDGKEIDQHGTVNLFK